MTKKTKKLLAAAAIALLLILAVVICFALPGQGGPAESTGPSTTTPGTTAPGSTAGSVGETDPTGPSGTTAPTKPEPTEPKPTDPPATEPDHTHEYVGDVTAPTCTEDGYTTYTCDCGDTYTDDVVKATGHTWGDWMTTKEPTETEEGEAVRTCDVCAEEETKKLDKVAHTHNYDRQITPPTCTEKGRTTYTCTCGHSYKEDIAVAEHQWTRWETARAATPDAEGEMVRKCKTCGKQESQALVYADSSHTHSYTDTVVDPTCVEDGYTLHMCSCGHSYKDTIVECRGYHDSTYEEVLPTCTEDGYIEFRCACGHQDVMYEGYLKSKGHSYGDWVTTKEATATEEGLMERICSACGNKETQVVPATSEQRDTYIDPRIKVERLSYGYCYKLYPVILIYKCDWDISLSIYVNENNGFDITYYQQDGTKITYTLNPPESGSIYFLIQEDGTYKIQTFS